MCTKVSGMNESGSSKTYKILIKKQPLGNYYFIVTTLSVDVDF